MKEKKYYGLYRELKKKILTGEYVAGEKLPSKRDMVARSGMSMITVQHAYAMLEEEGYVAARERSGYYVLHIDTLSMQDVEKDRADGIVHLPLEASDGEGDFEYSVWFKTVRRVISEQGERLFIRSPGKGCAILRNAIADYLIRYRGMRVDPRCIVIGSGSEQLYESAVKLLRSDRQVLRVGIEDPCYDQIPAVYQSMGAEVCRLPMGRDGIESVSLREEKLQLLHVTPFHSYPSGVTTSISKRYEYLNWAAQSGNYIVEDDFDSEFFIPGNPIESLYALDGGERVIYMNTFSKSLSASMRMGYMILPENLLPLYEERLEMFSCTVPVLDQYVLAEFIASGSFERHLNRQRRKQSRRE